MNKETGIPPAPRQTKPWVIVIVVLVVLCCLCLGAVGLIFAFWDSIRQTLQELGLKVFLPLLTPLA